MSTRTRATIDGRGIDDPAATGDTLGQEIIFSIARSDVGGVGDGTGSKAEGCKRRQEESGELHDEKDKIQGRCIEIGFRFWLIFAKYLDL